MSSIFLYKPIETWSLLGADYMGQPTVTLPGTGKAGDKEIRQFKDAYRITDDHRR